MSHEITPFADLIADALAEREEGVAYRLARGLGAAFPDRYVLSTTDPGFDVFGFAAAGHCRIMPRPDVCSLFDVSYQPLIHAARIQPLQTWSLVTWQNHHLEYVTLKTSSGKGEDRFHRFLVAASAQIAENFFLAVCGWRHEVVEQILVYEGRWRSDASLLASIRTADLEDVILPPGLRERIVADIERFFDSEDVYNRHRVPWRHGVLFVGPPGNGKTCMIRALVNRLARPCLLVRGLEGSCSWPGGSIGEVFARARATAPCVLVIEDLDRLFDEGTLASFLHETDGFASNRGILVLATTNRPERLDPALHRRAGRFDRQFAFPTPDRDCRIRFLRRFSESLGEEPRLDDAACESIADETSGFSYASLRDLLFSAANEFAANPSMAPMLELVRRNIQGLRPIPPTEFAAVRTDPRS
jgi:hypothetical protein